MHLQDDIWVSSCIDNGIRARFSSTGQHLSTSKSTSFQLQTICIDQPLIKDQSPNVSLTAPQWKRQEIEHGVFIAAT